MKKLYKFSASKYSVLQTKNISQNNEEKGEMIEKREIRDRIAAAAAVITAVTTTTTR